ncbi:MAG: DNA double-strand break repair nuclease NurA [Chloroflexota bacterium]|nr:MAG: DNA double-strand break repair nuclease NurA [Chloroflexota bacterium]
MADRKSRDRKQFVQLTLPFDEAVSCSPHKQQPLDAQQIAREIAKHPHIFVALVQNTLTVAHSLRDNYFRNTAGLVSKLREQLGTTNGAEPGTQPLFAIEAVDPKLGWDDLRGEEIAFIDGGIGSVEILSQVPMLLRVGTYKVKTGETILSQREEFGFYPVIFGDLAGGSKERKDYPDIVRIIAELLGVLHTLHRYPELDILVLHGPLVYLMGQYAGHIPFTEGDMDTYLRNYSLDQDLKTEFQSEAEHIYPQMTGQWRSSYWLGRLEGQYEPICLIRFLLWKILQLATDERRPKKTLICGVAERGTSSEFLRRFVFQKAFERDRDFFNGIFGRKDINSAKAAVDRLGYNDPLLLSMLLRSGEYSEPFDMDSKYREFRGAIGGTEVDDVRVDYTVFRPDGSFPFPRVSGFYLQVSDHTFPIRIEVFGDLASRQVRDVAQRIYLYSTLLPGYAFPVGLDIADKFAKVPQWLTDAYGKLIKYHLRTQLYEGRITDEQMRRILIQALYLTQRDWLFRPIVR